MFDNYALKARYYPVVIVFSPIIILGFFYSLQFDSIFHLLASAGAAGALTYLFSQLGRDQGKRKEITLWAKWGGAPTVQLLRLRNKHIDGLTKKRYHQKLNQFCPAQSYPTTEMEQSRPQETDDTYQAWTKYLISQTRDKQKFSLLYKENVSYGFRRNLWGLKPFAISYTLILMLCNYLFWAYKLNTFNPVLFPDTYIYSTIAICLIILFWLLVVTRSWVKLVAFAYAERLFECVDNL